MSVFLAHIVFFLVMILIVFCGYAIKEKLRRRREALMESQNSDIEWIEIMRVGTQRRWEMYERWLSDGWSPISPNTFNKEPAHNWKKEGF